MRLTVIEAICLVAIGVAMVELHDGQRLGRPAVHSAAALATAPKAAVASPARSRDVPNLTPHESYR